MTLVFLDTETTGLSLDDEIWEVGAIRREFNGRQTEVHFMIEHDIEQCVKLPEPFASDHAKRYHLELGKTTPVSQKDAAFFLAELFYDKPHVVGAIPNFDTERIALLLRRFDYEPNWHYHLIDVEALAVGYLAGEAAWAPVLYAQGLYEDAGNVTMGFQTANQLPWDSNELSRMCGVEPPNENERHTAMADALWAMRWYDAIMTEYHQ
jgi:hypothetical protein